jgi:murein DD-endopeptidase MepM/ murein hydrolase activator NlpD
MSAEADIAGQNNRASVSGIRRSRTSAAMLGLALSMGASGVLLPRHGDEAVAAEAKPTGATVTSIQSSDDNASRAVGTAEAEYASAMSSGIAAEHIVRERQTLWQISNLYQVSIDVIAAANQLESTSTLFVGQVLRIPGVRYPIVAESSAPSPAIAQAPESGALSNSPMLTLASSDEALKQDQDAALQVLQQKRDELRSRLDTIVGSSQSPSSVTAGEPVSNLMAVAPSASMPSPQVPLFEEEKPEAMDKAEETPERLTVSSGSSELPMNLALNSVPVVPTTSAIPDFGATQSVENHEVMPGETVMSLARVYGVSPDVLVRENGLGDPNFILVGQVLRIPSVSMVDVTDAPAPLMAAAPTDPVFVDPNVVSDRPLTRLGNVPVADPAAPQSVTETSEPLVLTDDASESVVPATQADSLQLDESPSIVASSTQVPSEVLSTPGDAQYGAEALQFSPQPSSESASSSPLEQLMNDVALLRDQSREQRVAIATPTLEQANIAPPAFSPVLPETVETVEAPLDEVDDVELAAVSRPMIPSPSELQRDRLEPRSGSAVSDDVIEQAAESTTDEGATSPDLVAAAPLGVENYRSVVEPITGRMVSPDLPPLPSADNYLPGANNLFNGYIWPSSGVFTSGYGWRWGRMHRGIDIAAPIGTPIVAAAPGVIEFSGWNSGGYGNMVEIRHADGSMTRYAHNSRNLVQAGQRVEQGQQIAEMGSTGYSTGPHVHFEIHLPSQGTVNPMAYLPAQ